MVCNQPQCNTVALMLYAAGIISHRCKYPHHISIDWMEMACGTHVSISLLACKLILYIVYVPVYAFSPRLTCKMVQWKSITHLNQEYMNSAPYNSCDCVFGMLY